MSDNDSKETLYVLDSAKYAKESGVKSWAYRLMVVASDEAQEKRIESATKVDAWDVDRVLMSLARVRIMHSNNIHSMREHFNVVVVDNPNEARLRYEAAAREAKAHAAEAAQGTGNAVERVLASRQEGGELTRS